MVFPLNSSIVFMMLHLAHEKINYTFVIFGVNLCVCVGGGGGGSFTVLMFDEKHGRPICGYTSLFCCFLGNLRLHCSFLVILPGSTVED